MGNEKSNLNQLGKRLPTSRDRNVANRYDGVDKYAVNLIRFKARQMVGRAGFLEADQHDLEQELVTDLLRRLPRFNRQRAKRSTFIARIVNNHIATLVEAQKAGCRDYRRCQSLEELQDTQSQHLGERSAWLNQDALSCSEQIIFAQRNEASLALRLDLDKALAKLPVNLRSLCVRLTASTISDIARELGIPRTTLYEAIHKVRALFEDAGLKSYIGLPTQFKERR
jgi:RNA polymerase sigma-70 factor (ECF subfamily)